MLGTETYLKALKATSTRTSTRRVLLSRRVLTMAVYLSTGWRESIRALTLSVSLPRINYYRHLSQVVSSQGVVSACYFSNCSRRRCDPRKTISLKYDKKEEQTLPGGEGLARCKKENGVAPRSERRYRWISRFPISKRNVICGGGRCLKRRGLSILVLRSRRRLRNAA